MGEIAELPQLSDYLRGALETETPEDFVDLFLQTHSRLFRNTRRNILSVVAFRHDDVRALASNRCVGMVDDHEGLPRFYPNLVFTKNPPVHGPLRQLIAQPFGPKHVAEFKNLAERIAKALLDNAPRDAEIDICSAFCERLTMQFWGSLLNMQKDTIERLSLYIKDISLFIGSDPTKTQLQSASEAMERYIHCMSEAVHTALQKGNPLVASMAASFADIPEDKRPPVFGEMIAANIFEGLHTAALAVSNAIFALLASPEHMTATRANPNMVSSAALEGLRLWPPLTHTPRLVLEDFEYAGVAIPKGARITLFLATANRDPGVFTRPNEYDLSRRHLNQVTFGGGLHICPGRHVVGLLVGAAISTIVSSDIRMTLMDKQPKWIAGSAMRQLRSLRVVIRQF